MKNASVLISLTLAVLYAFGLTFQQGFMIELGLDETQFIQPIDHVFFSGFFSIIITGLSGFLYLFYSAVCIIFISIITIYFNKWIQTTHYKWIVNLFSDDTKEPKEDFPFLDFSMNILSYIVLVFVLLALLILSLQISHKAGQKYANTFIENTKNNTRNLKAIKFSDGSDPLNGYTIICSTQQCAYLINGKLVILNNRDIKSISDLGKN